MHCSFFRLKMSSQQQYEAFLATNSMVITNSDGSKSMSCPDCKEPTALILYKGLYICPQSHRRFSIGKKVYDIIMDPDFQAVVDKLPIFPCKVCKNCNLQIVKKLDGKVKLGTLFYSCRCKTKSIFIPINQSSVEFGVLSTLFKPEYFDRINTSVATIPHHAKPLQ